MYILMVGGGKVGYYLARSLIEEGHEILVIERDPRKAAMLRDELVVGAMEGDGCEAATLAEAGAARADVLIAVTGDDEDNLVACQVARHRFSVPRTIARINNPKNQRIFRRLGVDVTISSTELILSQIKQEIPAQTLLHLLTLRNVGVSFVELELTASSPALGRSLHDLHIPDDCILPLVVRAGKQAIIPSGSTVLEAGDQVIAVSSEAGEEALRRILCG